MAQDYIIPIQLTSTGIVIPTEWPMEYGDTITWEVGGSAANQWLVSFTNGHAFTVEATPTGAALVAPNTLEVRTGQRARALQDVHGRFLYRVAFLAEDGKIHAVFDCPTIIIK